MPSNVYHFENHWHLPFPRDVVWEVLSKPTKFPLWWQGVYLKADTLDIADQPNAGQRTVVLTRGWLPYKLRWTIETVRLEKPHLIEFKTSGDFSTEASRWILQPQGTGTDVILDWNPRVEKPIIRFLSPVLKPLFRWNHYWAMSLGEKQLVAYLRQQTRTQQ